MACIGMKNAAIIENWLNGNGISVDGCSINLNVNIDGSLTIINVQSDGSIAIVTDMVDNELVFNTVEEAVKHMDEIFATAKKKDDSKSEEETETVKITTKDSASKKAKKCCLCGKEIDGYGNNPWPLAEEGECCDECNETKVIPARIEKAYFGKDAKDSDVDKLTQKATKIEHAIKACLTKWLKKAGYTAEDVEDYVVISVREEETEEGEQALHVQVRNDLVGYYELPSKAIDELDATVAPGYFEPYNEYTWDAWIFKATDAHDSEATKISRPRNNRIVEFVVDVDKYTTPIKDPDKMKEEIEKIGAKVIGIDFAWRTMQDFVIKTYNKEQFERVIELFKPYSYHIRFTNSPYK